MDLINNDSSKELFREDNNNNKQIATKNRYIVSAVIRTTDTIRIDLHAQ